MINEQLTLERFGYLSSDLRPTSSKLVVAICEQCLEDREVKKHVGVKSKMCIKCQRVNQAKKIGGVKRFGRKHSEETKKKIGQSNTVSQKRGVESPNYGRELSEFAKQRIAEANSKRVWSDESRAKLSASHKGKIVSDETKKLWSRLRTGNGNHRYGKPAAHGKGQWYVRKNGDKIWLRSKWEYATAVYLDTGDYGWEYEFYAFPITFIYKGKIKQGTYRPDFKVNEEIWEVKGYWRDDAKVKFDAFAEQYPQHTVRLLNENALRQKGILK